MTIPDRCFTCGKDFGGRSVVYPLMLDNGYTEGVALDYVGLVRYCCRQMLRTHVSLTEKFVWKWNHNLLNAAESSLPCKSKAASIISQPEHPFQCHCQVMPQSASFLFPQLQSQKLNGCLHCSFYPPTAGEKQGSKRSNSLHLPDDLIYAILSRLPTKSVIRLTCVSKTWNSFIHDDPYFLQLRQSVINPTKNNLFLFVCPNPSDWGNEWSKPHVFLGHVPIREDQGHLQLNNSTCILSMPNQKSVDLNVQSVNGLLCFHPRFKALRNCCLYSSHQARFATHICNPTTRQVVTLPHDNTIDFPNSHLLLTHFGYDPLEDKFKVLRVILNENGLSQELRILTVGEYVWRNVTHARPYDLNSNVDPLTNIGTCVNGAIHWLDCTHKVITVFDLGREQFREIPIFDEELLIEWGSSLIEFGGNLSLVKHMEMGLIELSILKDYENHVWIHERIILEDEILVREGCYLPSCRVYTQEIMLLPYYIDNNQLRVCYYDTERRNCRSISLLEVPMFLSSELYLGGVQLFAYQENFKRL